MARKPMVTRTFVTTEVTILALDIVAGEPFNEVVTVPRTCNDEKKLLKKVQEMFDTDTRKAVHIIDSKEVETLYGMEEAQFIANAVILDPTTRKSATETEEN